MTTVIAMFPWWAQVAGGLVLLGLGVAYLLMPFAVFGIKPRLEEIELQLGEIRAELRVIAMRLAGDEVPQPTRPADFAPPRASGVEAGPGVGPHVGPAPEPAAWRRDTAEPRVEPQVEPRAATRPDPRLSRASDDWSATRDPAARPAPRVPPVRLNDPWADPAPAARPVDAGRAPDHRAEQRAPERPSERPLDRSAERPPQGRVDSFLASENEAGPRATPTIAADHAYDDMPPEGLSQVLRPTHFDPPHGGGQGGVRPRPDAARAPQPPVPHEPEREPPSYPAHSASDAPWRRREEMAPRPPAGRDDPDADDRDSWRRPRAEPTLRWPPRT